MIRSQIHRSDPRFPDALREAITVLLGHKNDCSLEVNGPSQLDPLNDHLVILTVIRHREDDSLVDERAPSFVLTSDEWRAALLSALLPEIDTLHVPAPSYTPRYDILSELVGSIQDDVKAANDGQELTAKAWRTLTFGMVLAHAIGEQHGAADPEAVARKQVAEKKARVKP